jgi:hypothetical protein
MDLSQITYTDESGGAVCPLRFNGEEIGAVRLLSTRSPEFRAVLKRIHKRNADSTGDADEIRDDAEAYAAITIGFIDITENGEEPKTPEQFIGVYKRHWWIREQVQAFLFDRENFIRLAETD